jgi:hypothetical protein
MSISLSFLMRQFLNGGTPLYFDGLESSSFQKKKALLPFKFMRGP